MKISIITATHKRPKKLKERCLSSILSQTSSAFEWVVINDGSDVETKEIIDSVSSMIDLKYSGTSHRGLIASRNLGLEMATGDLISFLDDDNKIYPEFVERMMNHFSQNSSISMATPVRTQRRDVYDGDTLVKRGKQFTRPLPDATNEDIVKNSYNAWFDSNGFVHRPNRQHPV
jgi:glycosyltransferase involved in cell wall biosynthesis